MNRDQKTEMISSLKGEFSNSKAAFVVGYKGLTVKQLQTLRRELSAQQGTLKVAKARLMRRAVQGLEGVNDLAPYFKEQIGVVFVAQEAPAVAKVLHEFSKNNAALLLVAGFFDSRVMPSESVVRLASLPSRDVLLAQVCGTLKAPTVKLVRVLDMQIMGLLWTLQKIAEQKQQ
ncbi:MAG: 50S ribosomal protein L10 [Candidatus Dependentiae bacterium]|nr:50S ribosomal protein L10 [Candidatus Dependentiae bacterium]